MRKARSKDGVEGDEESSAKRYSAPALEKGLDILELLAQSTRPMTVSQITQKLGRSVSELFRMIHVLEHRGFIEHSSDNGGYTPTDRLFALGMEQAPIKNLLEIALPVMRELSGVIGQSCHMAVRSREDMVVVARMESAEQIGFTVRIGYRKPIMSTTSGVVLFAYQEEADRKRWIATFPDAKNPEKLAAFIQLADRVRARGYERQKSGFTSGITDVSAPILRGAMAAAALTVPYVRSTALGMPVNEVITHLRDAAARISEGLLVADHRI